MGRREAMNKEMTKNKSDPFALQGTYTGEHIGKEIKHKIGKTFDELIAEATKPPVVPEEIAKYVAALVQGTHEITEVTIRPKKTWVGLTDADLEQIKLLTFEKEINANGEEQEAVNLDQLIRAAEQFCKEKNYD